MKKILLLIITISGLYLPVYAQDYVTYNGDNEKILLSSAKTPDEFLKLSLSSELSDTEAETIYDKFIGDVKQLNLTTSPGDVSTKHLKKIYQVIHDHYLRNYNPHSYFGDIIINGDYNGLTASILYAYVLETLKIPYQIKQLPAHVFVIANPGPDAFTFETVDLTKGFYVFDDQSKQRNVNELVKHGYLNQSDVIRGGVELAFDGFFYAKPEISLQEAVALLYFNKAFEEMQVEKTGEAYSDLYKSDVLFPDNKNKFFEDDLMRTMIGKFKFDDLKDWKAITKVVNSKTRMMI